MPKTKTEKKRVFISIIEVEREFFPVMVAERERKEAELKLLEGKEV